MSNQPEYRQMSIWDPTTIDQILEYCQQDAVFTQELIRMSALDLLVHISVMPMITLPGFFADAQSVRDYSNCRGEVRVYEVDEGDDAPASANGLTVGDEVTVKRPDANQGRDATVVGVETDSEIVEVFLEDHIGKYRDSDLEPTGHTRPVDELPTKLPKVNYTDPVNPDGKKG